jgi:hypothetical protein
VVKPANKPADPALKYYFEELGLPLSASENEIKIAYKYFSEEQSPGNYLAGSAEQKKAEERQAELKFAYEKLSKYFEDHPGTNISQEESFRFDGNATSWKEHQAKLWAQELKEFRAQESEVWKGIQAKRKKARLVGFVKRTRVMLTTVCMLAFAGENWHQSWNKNFRTMQTQTLLEQVVPDLKHSQHLQETHDKLIKKANDLKKEWVQDEQDSHTAVTWTWILAVGIVLWWLPKRAWAVIKRRSIN